MLYVGRPFLNASKRELLADCALPVAVLLMSFFGSYVFRDVKREYYAPIYTVSRKNVPHPIVTIISSNLNQFSKFFHCWKTR